METKYNTKKVFLVNKLNIQSDSGKNSMRKFKSQETFKKDITNTIKIDRIEKLIISSPKTVAKLNSKDNFKKENSVAKNLNFSNVKNKRPQNTSDNFKKNQEVKYFHKKGIKDGSIKELNSDEESK